MKERRRHALLVATSTYEDPGLRALRAPMRDATELAGVLGDPAIGAFTVEVLVDPGAHELRRGVEDFFADCTVTDTLLLHFACHGLKDEGGKLFLAAADTVRGRLESTAVPAEYVSRLMMRSRAGRAAVLLDCCYAGAFERGLFSRADSEVHVVDSFTALERVGGERGRAVLTASSAVEYAFEGTRMVVSPAAGSTMGAGPSLFTGALIEGLRTGDADLGGDGVVGLAELAEYVGGRVRAATSNQNPQLWMFGAYGDLTIARTARRRDSGTLPTGGAVQAEPIGHEQRLREVAALRDLLNGRDTKQALDAFGELDRLAQDPDTRVREAARRTLAAAAPRTAHTHVDLGMTTAGRPGPEHAVQVLGPPVVRATLEISSDSDWLRVRPGDQGIVLSVLAESPGVGHGNVVVRSATGDCTLTVRAEVAEHPEPPVVTLRKTEPSPGSSHPGPAARWFTLGSKTVGGALMMAGATERLWDPGLWPVLVLAATVGLTVAVVVSTWSRTWFTDRYVVSGRNATAVLLCVSGVAALGIRILVTRTHEADGFFVFAGGALLYVVGSTWSPLTGRPLTARLRYAAATLLIMTTIATVALLRPPADRAVARYDRPRGDILVEGAPVTGAKATRGGPPYLRTYRDGPLYAAVTGYASQLYGTSSLESTEDDVLTATRSSQNKGRNIATTIDSAAQEAAFRALGESQGAVVALDPRSGAILALVSTPSYDPSSFAGSSTTDRTAWEELQKNLDHPLLNRALKLPLDRGHLETGILRFQRK
ncbi:caspase family protein [Streptomyces sp. NPDC048420]|uniref:caspase family protein n=1 Tax=Streptomyces sp. NPDC048420 TaxID=3155755 RepID=UPI003436C589